MQIKLAQKYSLPAWDDYVKKHPDGNPYLLSGWGEVISRIYSHPVFNLIASDSNDNIIGILPLVHINHFFFGNKLFSMPFADLGGVLAENAHVAGALLEHAVRIAIGHNISTIELRHGHTAICRELSADGYGYYSSATGINKVRMLLDLPGSSAQLLAKFKAKLRSQVRRPQKEGLLVKSGGIELLEQFYRVFAENMRDLGSPVHAKDFIGAVINEFAEKVRIFIVFRGSDTFACSLTLGYGHVLYNPWASALRRHSMLSPNMLLYWAMLEYGCDQGYTIFDFGRSTLNKGTYNFKKQWGAVEHPLNWLEFTRQPKENITDSGQKFELAMRLWRKMPVSLSRILGPPIRKHIGL
jgi:FemAB-related protein (PEP-CTERM system-associated)